MSSPNLQFRSTVTPVDCDTIRRIAESTLFFRPDETDVAVSLAQERLKKGEASGYYFVFADYGERTVGFTCFGPIPCTLSSYDLYWIAVDAGLQGAGIGRKLVKATEDAIRERGGTRVYIETSLKPLYDPTRQFYLKCDYAEAAVFEDFYGPGDSKVVYVKVLSPAQP